VLLFTHLGNGNLVGRVHETRRIVVYVRHPNNNGNGALFVGRSNGAGDLKRYGVKYVHKYVDLQTKWGGGQCT